MKKLNSKKGESILETLVALIIIVFSFTFLVQSIVVSNAINAKVKQENKGFKFFEYTINNDGSLNVSNPDKQEIASDVDLIIYSASGDVLMTNIAKDVTVDLYSVQKYENTNKVKFFTFVKSTDSE